MSTEKNTTEIQELEQQLAGEKDPQRQLRLIAGICQRAHYSNSELAYTYAERLFEIAESLQDKFWMGQALNAQVIYGSLSAYRDHQTMFDKLSKAAHLFEDIGDSQMQAKVLYTTATKYYEQRNLLVAKEMCRKAMTVFEQIVDKNDYAHCKQLLAVIDHALGRLQEALEGMIEALMLHQELGQLYGQSICHSDLGGIYMDMRDYPRAITHYSSSLDIIRQLGQPMVEAIGMLNLANVYREVGNVELALQSYRHAQSVFHQLGYHNREGVAWIQIGEIHKIEKEYEQAQECYRQAENLFSLVDEREVQSDLVYLYHRWAELYMEQQRWKEAQDYLQKALDISERAQLVMEKQVLHEGLAEVYEKLGDIRKAFYHYKQYATIKGTILDQEKQKAITEMQAKFDVETAEREKELFRVKNVELSAALDEVRTLNDRLTKLNVEKNEVLSVVAHDLKSPLSGVKMVSALLKEHCSHMSREELYQQLDTIEQTSERMLAIATSLLKAQTLEDGGLYDTVEAVDVATVVESIVERYRNIALQKNIRLDFEVTGRVKEVLCNREGLGQVVENLVSNAVKFTPAGRNVYVRLKQSPQRTVIEVHDEGPGISRRDKARLFGKFARLSAQPTAGESTTGLGLWIAKQTMEAMGGDLRCISRSGQGALFRVLLQQ